MGRRRFELDTRVLSVFFFVAIPFVAFGSFVVVNLARGVLQDAMGMSLEQQAVEHRMLLEHRMDDAVTQLHLLALDPQVRATVAGFKPAAADEKARLELATQTELAGRLREIVAAGAGPKLLQLVDAQGRLVASSGKVGHAENADDAWFRFLAGREYLQPQPYVGDFHRLAGNWGAVLELAYPIVAPADNRWLGGIRALLDVQDLYAAIAPLSAGSSGETYVFWETPRAYLVRASDGIILAAEDGSVVLKQALPDFEVVQTQMAQQRSHWLAPEVRAPATEGRPAALRPARLMAATRVAKVPGADWLVVVERSLDQALAPIKGITRYLWIHFLGAFGTVILAALYFSFKLERPIIEEGLHLHEEHVPSGVRTTES